MLVPLAVALASLGTSLIWHRLGRRWGATDAEVHEHLAGDELVSHPAVETTHAITIAAPAPCTDRAAISVPVPGASAHAADASENTDNPTTNTRRRPNRSPSAAPVISRTAKLRL